jgi:hypothetical protein
MITKIQVVCEKRAKATFLSRFSAVKSDVSTLKELGNELTQAQLRFIVRMKACFRGFRITWIVQSNTALYMGGAIAKMYDQIQHGE